MPPNRVPERSASTGERRIFVWRSTLENGTSGYGRVATSPADGSTFRQSVQMDQPLLRKVDAVTFRVPDLDSGLAFYGDALGHALRWRNDEIGQAALSLPDSETEIVLTTQHGYEPNWLVRSADDAATAIEIRRVGAASGNDVTSPWSSVS